MVDDWELVDFVEGKGSVGREFNRWQAVNDGWVFGLLWEFILQVFQHFIVGSGLGLLKGISYGCGFNNGQDDHVFSGFFVPDRVERRQ